MKNFTEGNAAKQIISFSLPMLVGNIFQQLYSMTDAIVVGRYNGGESLAAVGTSLALVMFLLSILIGLTTGASVLISQFYGAGQEDSLKKTVSTSVIFLSVLSLVITLIGFFGAPLFMRLMGTPDNIYENAVTYLRIIMIGIIFSMMYNLFMAYMRALGDSRRPLYMLILSSILNIVLDVLFVAYFRWGVAGAAWATIIAQAAAFAACYFYMSKYMPLLRVSKLIFDKELFFSILKYSVPAAVQMSVTSLASLFITRLVNSFGSISIAGYTAAVRIDMFATMPLSSLSMAVSTFVAQNIGAGLLDRAKKGFRLSLIFMVIVGIAVSAFAIIFGEWLISMFIDASDPSATGIIEAGARYLAILAFFYTFFAIFFAFNGFFRGVGDAVIVMILTISSLTIRTVSAYFLASQFGMNIEAVAFSIPIGWGICGAVAFVYYKKGLWSGKAVVNGKVNEIAGDSAAI